MKLFYEKIQKIKLKDAKFNAIILFRVINGAIAGKKETMEKLLKDLDLDERQNINEQLDKGKLEGFPIEDK